MPFILFAGLSYLIQVLLFLANTKPQGVGHRQLYPACIFYCVLIVGYVSIQGVVFSLAIQAGIIGGCLRFVAGSVRLAISNHIADKSNIWWVVLIVETIASLLLAGAYYNDITHGN